MRVRGLLLASLCGVSAVFAQTPDEVLKAEGYIRPSALIEQAVVAPWFTNFSTGTMNPQGSHLMSPLSDGMPPLAALGKDHVILGGKAIDTIAERERTLTMRSQAGIRVMDLATGKVTLVELPKGIRVFGPRWSPDGTKIAFLGIGERETLLMVADAVTGKSRRVTDQIKMTEISSFEWLADSKRIVAPVKSGARRPEMPKIATGPRVRLSDTKIDDFPTFPSLLQNPEEIEMVKYYLSAQIGVIDSGNGVIKRVGNPTLLANIDPSPNGDGFLMTEYQGEFSYIFPASMGARRQVLLDETGKEAALISYSGTRKVEIKKEDQPPTRTGLSWRPDGAGLSYLRDEELPKDSKEKPKKQLVQWKAPFGKDDVSVVYEQADAFGLVGYGSDGKTLFISKVNGKKTETMIVVPGSGVEPKKVWETSSDTDFYSQPGSLMFVSQPGAGRRVRMSADGLAVYLAGTQYFKNFEVDAPRSFVDKLALDGEMKPIRLWQGSAEKLETAEMIAENRWLMTRQSGTEVPQMVIIEGSAERQLTANVNHVPDVTLAEKKRMKVKRDDGFEFMITATMPKNTTGAAPAFIWFYPTEYTTQKVYDESIRTFNRHRFAQTGSASVELMALDGYVVVDADFPITGPENEANNTFTHQLRMNFTAIVDALVEHFGVDRKRIAIGGHSYGAFGTANALAHTSFFKAGIAGDGNYNRTLTPFGFQREPRDIWRARETYTDISAILHAEKINGALLMYHGMQDQNVGTFPIHSERMYSALEALGKPAAMYMYPYEDHGQIARETRLDMWARWMAWLDKYVKNPAEPKKEEAKPGTPPPM